MPSLDLRLAPVSGLSLCLGVGGGAGDGLVGWRPIDVSGGWWLTSRFGVSKTGSQLTAWSSRGTLTPTMTVKGSNLTVDSNGDIDFPANAASFLYEGTPVADVDSHTLFWLARRDLIATGESLFGKYVTTSARRAYQLFWQSAAFTPTYAVSADGTAVTSLTVGPLGAAGDFHYAVIRKNGTDVDSWWNGIATLNQVGPATIFDSTDPLCIGGRSGNASTNATSPFDGAFREFGYYDTALSDANVDLLLDYLASRM